MGVPEDYGDDNDLLFSDDEDPVKFDQPFSQLQSFSPEVERRKEEEPVVTAST